LHQLRGTCRCGGQIQRSVGGAVLLVLGKLNYKCPKRNRHQMLSTGVKLYFNSDTFQQ
jgi:hypothetical protein